MNNKVLKYHLILSLISLLGITALTSCEQNEQNEPNFGIMENNTSLLSEAEMTEFGISSIAPVNFSAFMDYGELKSASIEDSTYLVKYLNIKSKTVVKLLPNNNFILYFYNDENQLIKDASITINNIDENGYVSDFIVDSDMILHIEKDRYNIKNLSRLKSYNKWSDCVGNAVTACYTEDLGCAALFTFTFPFAFSAVMIACI